MNREAAIVSESEYVFELGCPIPKFETLSLAPEERIFRALYLFTFHPRVLIDVYIVGDMAELCFCIRHHTGLDTDTFNAQWRWERGIIEAFEKGAQQDADLPETIQFGSIRQDLSEPQFRWFADHIGALPFNTFKSDAPITAPYRDGDFRRGRAATSDNAYVFDVWNEDQGDPQIERYFLEMFQLACSVLKDTEHRPVLLEMQRYFYGFNVPPFTDFVFPLIANS